MRDGPSAIDWLCNPVSQVSCHYVVTEEGGILQLVPDERRAWHAGRGSWGGCADINSASIGIEIVNGGHDFGLPDFPDTQIEAVIALGHCLVSRYAIPPERVLAHSDIAPARKRDPGERFPWDRLASAGLGRFKFPENDVAGPSIVSGDQGDAVIDLQRKLSRYGYGVPISGHFDDETEVVVRAFQRHFRPIQVDGCADPGTRDVLQRLLAAADLS